MKKISLPGLLTIIVVLILAAFYIFSPPFRQWLSEAYDVFSTGNLDKIQSWLQNYREYGYLILLGAFLFQMFLFVVPSIMVMTLAVLMYGPVVGGLICIGGIAIAATVAFFLGKALSEVTLDKLIGHKSREKMTLFLEHYGFWTIAIFRISPFLSNDAVSFVGGLVKMNYWKFIGATLVGITPLAVLVAWVGRNAQQLDTALIIGSVVGLLGLAFYIIIDRREKKKKGQETI